jgi:hypothetical protein
VIAMTDQNGTVHQYDYDRLGRQIADRATTLGANVDGVVRRIAKTFEVRGMVERVTSYDAASGGFAVNDVRYFYNAFGQPTAEYQDHAEAAGIDTPAVQYAYADGSSNYARPTDLTYPNGRVVHYGYSDGADSRSTA